MSTRAGQTLAFAAAVIGARPDPGSKALSPQRSGVALVAAGSALALRAVARKKPGHAPAGVR
jgi:hypothetical protein